MIKGIVFDIDGTILDTTEFILHAFEHTLKTHGLPPLTREELRKLIGPPLPSVYKDMNTPVNEAVLTETHRTFQGENLQLSKPFENTLSTLEELHRMGIKIAAFTNRSNRSSVKTLELAHINHLFDIIISPEDVKNGKPNPEGLFLALSKMDIEPETALMVGDTHADIETGEAAGVKTVGITHGIRGDEIKESHPDFLIHNLSELLEIVKSV